MNEIKKGQPTGSPIADWPLHTGEMLPEAFVREATALLGAVCLRLGPMADRRLLLDGLRYCLRTSGTVATLCEDFRDRTRRQLSRRMEQISRQILSWAEAASDELSRNTPAGLEQVLVNLEFESLCAGHKWEEPITRLLHRANGGRVTIQVSTK